MDLKNVSDLLRNHYEKIILTLALVGLAVAVLLLLKFSEEETETIEKYKQQVETRSGAPVKPVNLTNIVEAVQQATNPPHLELDGAHKLFNPVLWQRKADGGVVKVPGGAEGVFKEVQITRITPLKFSVHLDKFAGNGYILGITNEAFGRMGIKQSYALNETNKPMVILREVRGPGENPSEVVIELKDTSERVAISKDHPLVRTNAYEADLKYNVENRAFTKLRVNSPLALGDEQYKIVAINPQEVVVSAANDKKYTIRQSPGP
jgi:hypothetical protein